MRSFVNSRYARSVSAGASVHGRRNAICGAQGSAERRVLRSTVTAWTGIRERLDIAVAFGRDRVMPRAFGCRSMVVGTGPQA
jgi:hypothetical protein